MAQSGLHLKLWLIATMLCVVALALPLAVRSSGDQPGHRRRRSLQVIRLLENDPGRELLTWPLEPHQQGLAPLKKGLQVAKLGDLCPLPAGAAISVLQESQVLLVADDHAADECRLAVSRLLERLRSNGRRRDIALVLEALPARKTEYIPSSTMQVLMTGWPYPVRAYSDLMDTAGALGVAVLGGGAPADWIEVLPPSAPDQSRRPLAQAPSAHAIVERFWRANDVAASVASKWLGERAAGEAVVVVFYGAAHLSGGPQFISERLASEGLRSSILVPYLKSWELALRQRFGMAVNDSWYQLNAMYRPNLIRDVDIVAAE